MRKKTGYSKKCSLKSVNEDRAFNIEFVTPMPVNDNDIENLFTCCDVQLNDIWNRSVGYVYPSTTYAHKYININIIGSYNYNGLVFTTEKIYLKYVQKAFASKEALLPYFKQIYGNSFQFRAFDINYK